METSHIVAKTRHNRGTVVSLARWTPQHSMIPDFYEMPWKLDMRNRTIILNNCEDYGIPNHPNDTKLFLNHREQLGYNVEPLLRIHSRTLPRSEVTREEIMNLRRYQSRYRNYSSLLWSKSAK